METWLVTGSRGFLGTNAGVFLQGRARLVGQTRVSAASTLYERIIALDLRDAAEMARRIYPLMQSDLLEAMKGAKNGRRLLANPDLRDDVRLCVQRETIPFAVTMMPSGVVRKLD